MKLAIFDVDGTIADRDSTEIYPEAAALIRSLAESVAKIALATNQGGPACHDAWWPISHNFPSLAQVQGRLAEIKSQVESLAGQPVELFVCYGYRTIKDEWLIPNDIDAHDNEASQMWRKPEPGMLKAAMWIADCTPENTTMYGDGPEDEMAAKAAYVKFVKVEKGKIKGDEK